MDIQSLIYMRRATRDGTARALREQAGLSRPEVADAVGVTTDCIYLWERGARVPRGEAARRYAALLRDLGMVEAR